MAFKLKAADGTNIAIPDGEYYFNTKARGRRMMLNSLSSDARRVYACLELATMGFQQELAVTMEGGEKRPLTPTDIKQQTGLLRQNVSRGLVELEDAGLAERRAPDGGALRKGQVLIYSWAVPRQPKEQNCNRARLQYPDWFPPSWEPLKPFISRYKYSITVDEVTARDYIEEGAEVARACKEVEIVAARFMERLCAGRKGSRYTLYVERTERTSSSSAVVPTTAIAKAEEDQANLYEAFKAAYPARRFDEAKAKPSFERKTKTQQYRILERLQLYLACERWQDAGGQYIPFAAKWLKSYDADPPPVLKKAAMSTKKGFADSVMEEAQRRFNNGTL